MRKFDNLLLLAVVTLLTFGGVSGFHGENSLEGVYRFLRLDTPDGPNTNQKGMLLIKSNHMCHIRVDKERETLTREDTDEERMQKSASIFRNSNAACGSYKINAGKVATNWQVSVQPGAEETEAEYVLEQDGSMLILAPATAPQFRFVYEKVE